MASGSGGKSRYTLKKGKIGLNTHTTAAGRRHTYLNMSTGEIFSAGSKKRNNSR